jgi:hypothetical protein
VLWIDGLKPAGRELFSAKGASEKATSVARWLELNEPSISERGWLKLHGSASNEAVRYTVMILGMHIQ